MTADRHRPFNHLRVAEIRLESQFYRRSGNDRKPYIESCTEIMSGYPGRFLSGSGHLTAHGVVDSTRPIMLPYLERGRGSDGKKHREQGERQPAEYQNPDEDIIGHEETLRLIQD